MQRREKILALVVGGLLLMVTARYIAGRYFEGLRQRQSKIDRITAKIQQQQGQARVAQSAAEELAKLEDRSLPPDPELARSLYQNWLLEKVVAARLRDASVTSSRGVTREGAYETLPFTLRARGDLEALSRFLYAFYAAPHLHQLKRLTIKPLEKPGELDLTVMIEALSLPRADRLDSLSTAPADLLAPRGSEAFAEIARRKLFSPPGSASAVAGPPVAAGEDPFAAARSAVFTAVVGDGENTRAWITLGTSGESLKVAVGDALQIGGLRATVVRLGRREMVIDSAGSPRELSLGENLMGDEPGKVPASDDRKESDASEASPVKPGDGA